MNGSTRRTIAYHEAGHVAAQLVFGHSPYLATIEPDDETFGQTTQLYGDVDTKKGVERMIISLFAGKEAELRVGGTGEGSATDDEQAKTLLDLWGLEEERLRDSTSDFVSTHWHLVERVANELLERGTLSMDELSLMFEIYLGDATEENLIQYRDTIRRIDSTSEESLIDSETFEDMADFAELLRQPRGFKKRVSESDSERVQVACIDRNRYFELTSLDDDELQGNWLLLVVHPMAD